MLEFISNLPDNVIGFSAKGTVTVHDYESVMIPAVEGLFARHKKIRILYHLGEEFEDFDAGAVWDDVKLGIRHLSGWERIAVVSDVNWIRTGVRVFGLAIPAEVRIFKNDELNEAKRWVAE